MDVREDVLARTDWPLLAQQKLALIEAIILQDERRKQLLDGLLLWIDAIQDAAESEGFPVVYLEGETEE